MKRNSARTVLYILLEIRYNLYCIICKANKDDSIIINNITEHLKELIKKNNQISDEELNKGIEFVKNIVLENIKGENKKREIIKNEISDLFIGRYEDSLFNLAQSYPILAYKLRGKENIKNIINYIDDKVNELTDNNHDRDKINSTVNNFKLNILESLDNDLIELSKYCGIMERFMLKRTLKKPYTDTMEYIESEQTQLMINFGLAQIERMINNPTQFEHH